MQSKRSGTESGKEGEKRSRSATEFFSNTSSFVCQSGLMFGSHYLQTRMLANMICSSHLDREEASKLLNILETYRQKLIRETLQFDSCYPGYRSPKSSHYNSKSSLLSDRRALCNLTFAHIQIFRLQRYLELEVKSVDELFALYCTDPFMSKLINAKLSGYNRVVSKDDICEAIAERLSEQISRIAGESNSFNRQPFSKSDVMVQLAQVQQHISWHPHELTRIYNTQASTSCPNLCKILMLYPEFDAEPFIEQLLTHLDSNAPVTCKSLYAYYFSELLKYSLNKELLKNYFQIFLDKIHTLNLILTPETLRNCQDTLEHYECNDNHKKLLAASIATLKQHYLVYATEVLETIECDCFYTKLGLLQGFILEGCQYLEGDTLNSFINIIKVSLKYSNLTALACATMLHNLPASLNGHETLNQMLIDLCQFQFTVLGDFTAEADDANIFAYLMMSNVLTRRAELSKLSGFESAASDVIMRYIQTISSHCVELEYFSSYEIMILLYEFLKVVQPPVHILARLGGYIKQTLNQMCSPEQEDDELVDEEKEELKDECKNILVKFLLIVVAFCPSGRADLFETPLQKYVFAEKPFQGKEPHVDTLFDGVINQCKKMLLETPAAAIVATPKMG